MKLIELAPGVYAAVAAPGLGLTNIGVVIEADGATVIDTGLHPAAAEPVAQHLAEIGVAVRRVVLSSSHVGYAGGSRTFPLAAVYGSRQISIHLDQAPNIAGYQRLYPAHASHFEDLVTRTVTHVVTEPAWLTPTVIVVPQSGQIAENLVVQVPAANVVFAGTLGVFGATPLAFDGDPLVWADSLDRVAELGAVVVPGLGPVGGADELDAQQRYLRACADANGDASCLAAGPWEHWTDRHHDQVNVERAALLARGDYSVPPTMRKTSCLRPSATSSRWWRRSLRRHSSCQRAPSGCRRPYKGEHLWRECRWCGPAAAQAPRALLCRQGRG